MIDVSQLIDLANWPPDPPPVPSREALWTVERTASSIARLFVRGEWGFEAQILHDGVLFVRQRFDTRGQAQRWAEAERKAIEEYR